MATNALIGGFNRSTGKKNQDDDGGGASNTGSKGATGMQQAFQQAFQKGQQKTRATQGAKSTLKRAKVPNAGLSTTLPSVGALIPEQKVGGFPAAKKGGRVTKTGLIYLHRGEQVIPSKMRATKKSGKQRTITKP